MPDHIHLVWMGLRLETDQRHGIKFLREHLGPALRPNMFQHQAYDHVLTEAERQRNAFSTACHYILENPLQAALVRKSEDWAFSGCVVPGYPRLYPFQEDFWPLFWKLYFAARAPNAGHVIKPPIQ